MSRGKLKYGRPLPPPPKEKKRCKVATGVKFICNKYALKKTLIFTGFMTEGGGGTTELRSQEASLSVLEIYAFNI